ncbi:CoA transferase [Acuticoccus mangrovi]|uniref:CoA transferase n=1 Tax=Acuticoccus mangrovi TaxID=2796142 RepID=A0A934IFK7_9HYPH|nr:CoA transferase [Acuticoccus mangrovi]MBJ3775744.1 CoA transferase [Acuticoccus mangrovi]
MTIDGTAPAAFDELMALRDRSAPPAGEVTIVPGDTILPSRFLIGETAASIMSAIGIVLSDIHEDARGKRLPFTINRRHLEANLMADRFAAIRGGDGALTQAPQDPWMDKMRQCTQPFRTADGRYFLPHLNLDHLKARVLGVLQAEDEVDDIVAAVARRNALELEDEIAAARACGGMVRTEAEWLAHPHGAHLAAMPVVRITRVGDGPKIPLGEGARLLSGVRVLDLTRILAGPVAARTLAEEGADVLMVTAPHLPQVPQHVRDTSHGKRSTYADLETAEGRATLTRLVEGADVFSQGYRPGVLEARGFGPHDLARIKPGMVSVSITCFGPDGPFSDRAGWEQVAQVVTGIAAANGGDGPPKLIPVPACDYMTGYLGAYGALVALSRRAHEGGSWHVDVSLCQAGMMLLRQGVLPEERPVVPLTEAELAAFRTETDTPYGDLVHLKPVLDMPGAPAYWERPTTTIGAHPPEWLAA